ncbi:MAG: hypothetical protein M0Z56_12425 [Desulfobacteraceae bacterium]|nr:hypothetical protein [Desulfobacteraceae bacterium]
MMICSLSNLSEKDLNAIHQLEKEIDTPLLAFHCHDIKSAILEDDALAKLERLEKKLGVSLLAVNA